MKFSPEMSNGQLIRELAAHDDESFTILSEILSNTEQEEFRKFLFDLADMRIEGQMIREAFNGACGANIKEFVAQISRRDASLINLVNQRCPLAATPARVGELKQLDEIDGAVRDLFEGAETIEQFDAMGSDYVHNFFVSALRIMQERNYYVADYRMRVDTNGGWARFRIALVDVMDRDGKSLSEKLETKDDQASPSPTPHGTPAGGTDAIAKSNDGGPDGGNTG